MLDSVSNSQKDAFAVRKGTRCSSSCVTRDHQTFGECLRAKNFNLNPHLALTHIQKAWDRELVNYQDAVRQGVQPAGTRQHHIDSAMKESERTGVAYVA